MMALPPGKDSKLYTIYKVKKSIANVLKSKIAPWFGEIGMGTQYLLPESVQSIIDSEQLTEVKNEKIW